MKASSLGALFGKTIHTPPEIFGPRYAVINLSRIGIRYFRIGLKVSDASRDVLVERFKAHPNIGWIFSADGWFNLAIGIWAHDNNEINDVSAAIRSALSKEDVVVFQSELTSLYSFGNRAIDRGNVTPMAIVDSTTESVALAPLEMDYIKLITMDDSLPPEVIGEIMNIKSDEVQKIRDSLVHRGVVVGSQDRVNYSGMYAKVFIDSSGAKHEQSVRELMSRLWKDPACIYVEKANGKYDIEFEIILETKASLTEYVSDFKIYEVAILTENLYTNLYPLGKTANLGEFTAALNTQAGNVIDFRDSKLWYLNHSGVAAYLDIYKNREYFERMEKSELDLFNEVAEHLRTQHPQTTFSLIDIGSGDGMKGRIFIETLGESLVKAYYPVDVQPIELAAALQANAHGAYAKHPTLLDFKNLKARFPLTLLPGEHQIYTLFGGTYGNFAHDVINGYLKATLSETSSLLISMPIREEGTSDAEIISSYASKEAENTAFGPLDQLGFQKADFERNPNYPDLYVQLKIEDERHVCSFVLKNDVLVHGRTFRAGTVFVMLTSWKPTLAAFKGALELDFSIEHIVHRGTMAIASVQSK